MTAAAARKLQKDIETVLKKGNEGLDEFSEYWDQATSARDPASKEKLGEELKKSINKLQRLRAQMREWIAQSTVPQGLKDKLEEARKKIEGDMQRFKDFERDLKTKAFSTSALVKGDELELEEAEKIQYQDWLARTIQSLKDQLDMFEADLEVLGSKKSLSSDEKSRQAQLRALQERHRWHTKKLEQLLRAVDNDAVEISDLAVVRDSVDMYAETAQDGDAYHDEGLYDCFDLTEFEERAVHVMTPQETAPKECSTPASSKEEPQKRAKDKDKRAKDKKDKKKDEKKAVTPQSISSPAALVGKALVRDRSGSDVKTILEGGAAAKGIDGVDHIEEEKVQEDQLLGEAEEFICKICQIHVVGCSPKLTSCSHLFCGDCIAQWFAQHPESQTWAQRAKLAGPERVVPCPVCKQALNERKDLYPVCGVTSRSENLLLWRMLSSLKIMCANHPKVRRADGKCDWIGEYGSYQKHIERCKNQTMADSGGFESEAPTLVQTPKMMPQVHQPPVRRHEEAPLLPAASASAASTPGQRASPKASPLMAPHLAPTSPAPAVAPAPRAQAPPKAAAPTVPAALAVAAAAAQAALPSSTPTGAPAAPPRTPATAAPTDAPSLVPQQDQGRTFGVRDAAPGSSESKALGASSLIQRRGTEGAEGSFMATAVSAFEPTGSNMVTVRQGDLIQVLEQHNSGWTYAKNLSLAGNSTAGWVPSWIVQQATSSSDAASLKLKAPLQPSLPQQPKPVAAPVVAPAPVSPAAMQAKERAFVLPVQQQLHISPAPIVPTSPTAAAAPEAPRQILRATAAFAATSASQLTLSVADLVEIVERHGTGWTYGRKAELSGAVEGWFPDWVVVPPK
eukprot:CAMPEP_0115055730 /NCGR_PEP_ID=MMETSP0227-20121206/4807_1 /TAXON_ID=89957 /ORGANISM="Polarella glacialis, Strain CCMP 1383" /LENGTH=850 /DNA_ID=CAMNT_0002440339 /DNA_START=75 /DNA_END=2627 /DNA_ORIENTATION=-